LNRLLPKYYNEKNSSSPSNPSTRGLVEISLEKTT
jgi:hypothetical protein